MELFIRIVDGQPFEHPIFADNFVQAFPDVDVNNLPPDFARFKRLPLPEVGIYEVCETTYERDSDIFKDVHAVRVMTEAERIEKQNAVKAEWAISGYASWIFNEEFCAFVPPTPRPIDGKPYRWDEATTSWIELTPP